MARILYTWAGGVGTAGASISIRAWMRPSRDGRQVQTERLRRGLVHNRSTLSNPGLPDTVTPPCRPVESHAVGSFPLRAIVCARIIGGWFGRGVPTLPGAHADLVALEVG